MKTLRSIVIVGAGLAGLRTLQELRRLGYGGKLTLIGAERRMPYDRPPLSKSALTASGGPNYLCEMPELQAYGVDLQLARLATQVDASARRVHFDSGDYVSFDACILAPGGRARTIDVLEELAPKTLRAFEDAEELRSSLETKSSLTIIGGGFMDCEVAATVASLGKTATIIELLPGPLWRVLGKRASEEIAKMHRARGVRILSGTAVTGHAELAEGHELQLSDGSSIRSDATLLALGMQTKTEWLQDSGVETGPGILCDAFGRTSAPGVWALGTGHWAMLRHGGMKIKDDMRRASIGLLPLSSRPRSSQMCWPRGPRGGSQARPTSGVTSTAQRSRGGGGPQAKQQRTASSSAPTSACSCSIQKPER